VICNIDHTLLPTDLFVRRPSLWLTESAGASATILCSPNFGYQHLLKSFRPEKLADLDLSAVRLVFNGAEPISESLCGQFMRTLKPFGLANDAMYPVYGLAEAGLAVAFPSLSSRFSTLTIDRSSLVLGERVQLSSDAEAGVTFVSVGEPIPDVQVAVRDAAGKELPKLHSGHIVIRGENVTRGYYEEPALNEQIIDAQGWLDTGDLGFFHQQQLYITGRAKDIIFISGQNIYPHDLEEIIINSDLVERGKLAISSIPADDQQEEQVVAFVLHRADAQQLLDSAREITRLLASEAGVRVHAVVPVPRIPKTTSGKVQRYLLLSALQKGEFEPLVQSVDAQDSPSVAHVAETPDKPVATMDRLLDLCNEQIEDRQLEPDDNLFELGISSLTLAQIHAAIEDAWPERVEITDLFDYPTVRELSSFLDKTATA
jgi:acyl-CoA synthetase (AMP-forming)/AMP-acid ligase II/acyl carrier protein